MRRALISRRTAETAITLRLGIEGRGRYAISTGIRFLDHMLELVARHGAFDLRIDAARAWIVRDHLEIEGEPDDVVSLLAVGGAATGVTSTGLRWRLAAATMSPGVAVGLSNLMTDTTATITVATGTLLVVQPGREQP